MNSVKVFDWFPSLCHTDFGHNVQWDDNQYFFFTQLREFMTTLLYEIWKLSLLTISFDEKADRERMYWSGVRELGVFKL